MHSKVSKYGSNNIVPCSKCIHFACFLSNRKYFTIMHSGIKVVMIFFHISAHFHYIHYVSVTLFKFLLWSDSQNNITSRTKSEKPWCAEYFYLFYKVNIHMLWDDLNIAYFFFFLLDVFSWDEVEGVEEVSWEGAHFRGYRR